MGIQNLTAIQSRIGQISRSVGVTWRLGAGAALVLCALSSVAVAQEDPVPQEVPVAVEAPTPKPSEVPKEPEEKVTKGTIASSGRFGTTGGVDVDSAGASPGDEHSVIAGSISRVSKTECLVKLTNSGKKSYSVSFAAIGVDRRGNKVLNRSFSGSVAPSSTLERTLKGCRDDLNLSVQLNSAR